MIPTKDFVGAAGVSVSISAFSSAPAVVVIGGILKI